ncbi:PREDICTED: WASH complex subunit FAM21-like [Nanorana parkeri]|uniref:WASH complex subunit FAM21-like n=1 Tax=Nanorana parkeri TaxID=125878 RepID=UPI000853F4AC|nr:PREDICTED: WASH complex subunit FAM21-like [Nanorana parkeri]
MNGPVSCMADKPVWERPWSLEEIRKSSHSWSLGADAGLLNFLKEFSQQTISKTHEIEKQLDGLVHEVKSTDCRLHNVFNDFLMLSNTQFIENRVYDEEVEEHIVKPEQGEKPEQEKTREQKEAELIPKIQEAVNYGLRVLETAFEQLDIKAGNSDSEDEEVNERVDTILEPKDLYIDRPLPYLIGSQLFMQQEDVGLGDLSSEGSVDNDRGSVIDSEEEEDEEEDKDNEESEEDFGNNSEEEKKMHTALSDEDEDNGSDLFGESDKEDEEEENDKSAKTRTKSFADELAARIQAEIPKRLEADEPSISSEIKVKKEKVKKEVKKLPSDDEEDDMFKPPKLTDQDFFGNKGGLFSGGKGLFDDDDEEEEAALFSDLQTKEHKPAEPAPVARPETLRPDVKKKPPYGGVSLFPGGENVINPSILADKEKRKPATPTDVAPKPVMNTSLFDDDVMFGGSPPAQPAAKAKPAADLFVDDGDLFNDNPSMPPATITKNKVAADLDKKTIQMPTEKPQPPGPLSKKHIKGLFSDEDDSESDLFSPSQGASKPIAAAVSAAPATKTSKALSLFDDEYEDLFGAAPQHKPMPAATKPVPQPVLPAVSKSQKSILFSSDEEEPVKVSHDIKPADKNKTDSSVPPKSKEEEKTEKKSSLFHANEEDDLFDITKDSQKKHHRVSLLFEEDEEPLFSPAGSSTKATGQTLEQAKTTVPGKVDTEKSSLFGVDKKPESKAPVTVEDTAPPAVQKNIMEKSVSVKESDDLFAASPPTLKHTKTKSTNVLSLFGDGDDEDMENLRSASASPKDSERVSIEKGTQARSTRVFQDEELLFSHELQKDNDPDVDLFASSSKKAELSAVKPSDGLGLFGEEDEDDLFSAAKPKKPPNTFVKKPSLEPSKEPSSLNVAKKETIIKTEGGEVQKPTKPAPIKSKSPSRIGQLQAKLLINPAALLPGAVPKLSGFRNVIPEADISDFPVAESSRSLDVATKSGEGVSFETPVQVDTLHNANKSRAKVGGKRRPPTRMGRKHASQDTGEVGDISDSSPISPPQDTSSKAALPQSNWQPDKEEPISSMKLSFSENDVQSRTKPKAPVNPLTPDVNVLFGSDLFGSNSLPDPGTSRQKGKLPVNEASSQPGKEGNKSLASVIDADGSDDDLFKSVKEKHKKTFQPTSMLDNEPDDDLFGAQKSQKKVDPVQDPVPPKVTKTAADIFEDDIFAAEAIKSVKKPKEKTASEANMFDDHSDIFADLTHKPKEKKSKKKVEAKSIFDDDMDDIFSTSASSTKKSKPKAKSTPPTSDTKQDTKVSSMFDDPLNVLGK